MASPAVIVCATEPTSTPMSAISPRSIENLRRCRRARAFGVTASASARLVGAQRHGSGARQRAVRAACAQLRFVQLGLVATVYTCLL